MSFKDRRSETIEQHEYETRIHDEQLGAQSSPPSSTEDSTSKLQSLKLEDESGNANGEKQKRGIFRALKDQIKASFPEAIQDVKIMKGLTALELRVKKEIQDPAVFPEVEHVAQVRRGMELCDQELAFLAKRKLHVRDAFAKYFQLDPNDVHPDDVPTVSFGGSGGGFRAMIGCLAYCEAFKQAGLWDCLTYVSGVSGSCWSLAAYYTFGGASMQNVLEHCKRRFAPYHPLSGEAIRNVLSAPGGARATLGPLIQKSQSGLQTVAMDLYSVFTTGWIFFQDDPASHPGGTAKKEVAGFQRSWYKYSSAKEYTDSGAEPLPIMTAIRHERPWKDWADPEHPFKEPDHSAEEHEEDERAWFQWFEMTPYEIGCDEIEAWVPTWAFGRPFSEGKSTMQLPEQSLALLLGLCTSAPAGPLTSYIATISRNLPTNFLGSSIRDLAHGVTKFWGKQGTEEFQNHHPLHACNEHNFLYHFTPSDPETATRPPGLENSPRLHLIDSGMDNNCPTYVFLHPARRADVIINMDASSDVAKDSFANRVNQIGNRKGLNFKKRETENSTAYAQIYDGLSIPLPETVVDSYGKTVPNPPAPIYRSDVEPSDVNETGKANEPELDDGTEHSERGETGQVTMIYMPILPNENAVKDFDPSTAKFSGSYNLVWTAEQVQMLVDVCEGNFWAGEGVVKEALWEAYLRRKREREGMAG